MINLPIFSLVSRRHALARQKQRFGPCFDFLGLNAELSVQGQFSVMSVSPGHVAVFPSCGPNKKVSFMAAEIQAKQVK